MLAVSEWTVDSPGCRHATVTLQAETRTPRRRTLSASFVRDRTPIGELPLARRQRLKNDGKARARALRRLDPVKHEEYLEAERVRKKAAAARKARGEPVLQRSQKRSCTEAVVHAELPSPAWKQQARERVAAELQRRDACEARVREARERPRGPRGGYVSLRRQDCWPHGPEQRWRMCSANLGTNRKGTIVANVQC